MESAALHGRPRPEFSLATTSPLTQKLWPNTSYIQLGRMNNWLYAIMAMFAQRSVFAVQNLGATAPFTRTGLAAWQHSLVAARFWSLCCHCELVDSSSRQRKNNLAWLAKSATNRSWATELFVRGPNLLATTCLEIDACSLIYHVMKVRGAVWLPLIQYIQSLFLTHNCYNRTAMLITYSSDL